MSISASEHDLLPITLTQAQWGALLNMVDRGIEDAEMYASDWADGDDPSGEYRESLSKSAADAREASQALWDQLS